MQTQQITPQHPDQGSTDNTAVVRRFVEECQVGGNMDTFHALIHPDFVDHTRPPGISPGPEGVLEQFGAFRQVLTGFDVRIVVQVTEGDLVATHKIFSGMHEGDFLGIPASGQRLELAVSDILRIRDGRIAEHWGVLNLAPLLFAASSAATAATTATATAATSAAGA